MLENILNVFCYDLEDDSWAAGGRRSYSNCENATKWFLRTLGVALRKQGYYPHETRLRTFQHFGTSEFIEIEPGGSDTTGHILHHFKAEPSA